MVTAIYFKKSDQRTKFDFLKELEKTDSNNTFIYSKKTHSTQDTRPRLWTGIHLGRLFTPLKTYRKEAKQKIANGINVEENKALEQLVKLIINTIYGVISSRYFDISNVIVSNNTTARARINVWLASRALNGLQSITDGFAYQPDYIYQIQTTGGSKKRPSLENLSNLKKMNNHRNVKKTSLNNESWKENFENDNLDLDLIDQKAEKHIKTFWNHYDIQFQFTMEHKKENRSKKIFYIKKGHYAMLNMKNQIIYKFRGLESKTELLNDFINKIDLDEVTNHENHQVYHLIAKHLLLEDPFKIDTLLQEQKRLTKINDYLVNRTEPGSEIIIKTTFKLTNEDFNFIDQKDWVKRKSKKYTKDYASMLKPETEETVLTVREILDLRIKDQQEWLKNI